MKRSVVVAVSLREETEEETGQSFLCERWSWWSRLLVWEETVSTGPVRLERWCVCVCVSVCVCLCVCVCVCQ